MRMSSVIKMGLVCVTLVASSQTVNAADWIEKVDITADGVDTNPVIVKANSKGYKSLQTSKHKFRLYLHAKAKKNKRIVAGEVGSYNGVRYWQGGDSSKWDAHLSGQGVAGGKKQSITYSFHPTVSLKKITWQGNNPVQACNTLLKKLMDKGHRKSKVLAKNRMATAYAFMQFDAVATSKKNARKHSWKFKNTTTQRKSFSYVVPVKCLAAPKRKSS